jgi:septal ring factor EnvC (AmiA/AmiB activator)
MLFYIQHIKETKKQMQEINTQISNVCKENTVINKTLQEHISIHDSIATKIVDVQEQLAKRDDDIANNKAMLKQKESHLMRMR